MRIGSLFTGAGGLDLAVQSVFGGAVVWHAEIDKAASRVLAHRFPGVPNLGSVTDIDWAAVPTVDVLCGGFPCQDVSAAGKRAGIKAGTRSGLWSVFADAIDALRPTWVVIENVRGLLSATAHRTVDDDADGDVEPATGVMGDGAGRPVLRAAGAVLGDLADLGYDAQWATVAAADVGAPHRRERVFILAENTQCFGLAGPEWQAISSWTSTFGGGSSCGFGEVDALGGDENGVALLPTPNAVDGGGGSATQSMESLEQGKRQAHLTDISRLLLLPTPNAQDGNGGGRYSSPGHQSTLPGEVRLLPTPRVGGGGDCESERRRKSPGLESIAVTDLLPTPTASDCTGGGQDPDRRAGHTSQLIDEVLTTRWGKYAPAIARWEALVGPAPAPTEPNKNGNPRLSAAFSEWLMGWPAGWVTDPAIGISRNDQLRIIGNGVCPQQAIAALHFLLAVSEVTP